MKKLIEFIKTKEKEEKNSSATKKSTEKTVKAPAPGDAKNVHPQELFWDDYSDIGYC